MDIQKTLDDHARWLADDGGCRANLTRANLWGADLAGADLTDANLTRANLMDANLTRANLTRANLTRADLMDANLTRANLTRANLTRADLWGANLMDANLTRADLWGAIGNMREVKSAQFDRWHVTYTADVLQIGCQHHAIDLWRKADPRWIAKMDPDALEWWGKYGALVLAMIDASPAKPHAGCAS